MPNSISRPLGYFVLLREFLVLLKSFFYLLRLLEAKNQFCPPRCLSFADNWLRLQRCVVVVNANPVSGNDAKLADYVSSVLLKSRSKIFDLRDTFKT